MKKSIHTQEYALVRAQLKAARENAGLSQRALASRLSVPHSWIAKVEAGERRIDVVELCWFLVACGVGPAQTLKDLATKLLEVQTKRLTSARHSS